MHNYEHPRPAFTVDIVAVRPANLDSVLLVRRGNEPFKDSWALPGGFVDENERPEDAGRRELAEETGLSYEGPLRLVGVYGDPGRDPRGWTVSAVYLALVPGDPEVRGADDAAEAQWFAANALPPLAFDHARIVADALQLIAQQYS